MRNDQVERYSRQTVLPNFGANGQEKLLGAKVLIIGAGGLGSPAALYLAGAGIGTIGIVDSDKVELKNLHRQVIHSLKDIGRPKAESAKDRMEGINRDVEVVPYNVRLASENIAGVIENYDIVLDCSDNFPTRFLVNDACVLSGKPLAHGGVFRYDGQAMTILPGKSACYRCLFPVPPQPGLIPGVQEAGVLGMVPGVIGLIQANEALKYILGIGELLTGKLLIFNSLDSFFRQVKVPKNPHCLVCGKK